MAMPAEYVGREQSYLKHRVLEQYLLAWAQKQGSNSKYREVQLVYVDCFAGPWKNKNQDLRDTSVHIGLSALESAARTWKTNIKVKAVFVEKEDEPFARLQEYLAGRSGPVETIAIHGEFGAEVDRINREIGTGAAFLFIDPTGWKGVAMQYIAPLARVKHRDVLINMMFNDVNRFKDDQREFLRTQMREFFGMRDADIPAGLGEDELLALYRQRLKDKGGLPFVANLAVVHPTQNRTWFHLVVGGHHHEVLRLFRNIESKVCGREADAVRAGARARARGRGQNELLFGQDVAFDARHDAALKQARAAIDQRPPGTHEPFLSLWTSLLQGHHVTRTEVVELTLDIARRGRLSLSPAGRRSIGDEVVVTWLGPTNAKQ